MSVAGGVGLRRVVECGLARIGRGEAPAVR